MKCSHCGLCCQKTMMLLSGADIEHLEEAGYPRDSFSRCDKQGFLILKNHRGHCFFYDLEKRRCRIYRLRPQGCRVYPVILSEQEGIIIDDICPKKETINERELRRKGKEVMELLRIIDDETILRNRSPKPDPVASTS